MVDVILFSVFQKPIQMVTSANEWHRDMTERDCSFPRVGSQSDIHVAALVTSDGGLSPCLYRDGSERLYESPHTLYPVSKELPCVCQRTCEKVEKNL